MATMMEKTDKKQKLEHEPYIEILKQIHPTVFLLESSSNFVRNFVQIMRF